ncbi:hypothetical protein K3495_g8539 [Podosphaera aphanis]|nr:hypothetical protein K3495_g8539 [Podosphaera aphanis]
MLQARRLGTELYVGIHSDESILENKGPTCARTSAVDACRWVTRSVTHAPYVTSLPWISHYGCKYVVHGDDITSDSNGEDCYRYVKAAGRFKVVKRTPSISTTDLVGRMLLCTRTHFIKSLTLFLDGKEGFGTEEENKMAASSIRALIQAYATDESGTNTGPAVWLWTNANGEKENFTPKAGGKFSCLVKGLDPKPGQRVVYVDGGFDLFSSGHIEFLKQVIKAEEKIGEESGWYSDEATDERTRKGSNYGPAFVVAGIHNDEVINHWKGVNYPIMNILERGLCVLQCKYINSVTFGAPFTPTLEYLSSAPWGIPNAVYHGPTSFMPLTYDPYLTPKELGIYREIAPHKFSDVNAGQIVQRILKSRDLYEERQRIKYAKGIAEEERLKEEKLL